MSEPPQELDGRREVRVEPHASQPDEPDGLLAALNLESRGPNPCSAKWVFALLRQAGKEPTGGSGRGVIVVQVPAWPCFRPAFGKFREGTSSRFLERVARGLGLVP